MANPFTEVGGNVGNEGSGIRRQQISTLTARLRQSKTNECPIPPPHMARVLQTTAIPPFRKSKGLAGMGGHDHAHGRRLRNISPSALTSLDHELPAPLSPNRRAKPCGEPFTPVRAVSAPSFLMATTEKERGQLTLTLPSPPSIPPSLTESQSTSPTQASSMFSLEHTDFSHDEGFLASPTPVTPRSSGLRRTKSQRARRSPLASEPVDVIEHPLSPLRENEDDEGVFMLSPLAESKKDGEIQDGFFARAPRKLRRSLSKIGRVLSSATAPESSYIAANLITPALITPQPVMEVPVTSLPALFPVAEMEFPTSAIELPTWSPIKTPHPTLPLSPRPREPRLNSQFLRMWCLEQGMRRAGKIEMWTVGRAEMVLAPVTWNGCSNSELRNEVM
ncbi:hypothetical protein YB2330_000523 [Saitoella coloradoensis]